MKLMRIKSFILKNNFTDRLIRFNSQNNINKIDKNNSILNKTLENKPELQSSSLEFRSNIYKDYSFNKFILKSKFNDITVTDINKYIIKKAFKEAWINQKEGNQLSEWSNSILKLVTHPVITYQEDGYLVTTVKTSTNKPFSYYCEENKQLKRGDLVVYKQAVDGFDGSYFCNVQYLTKLRVKESFDSNSYFRNIGYDNQLMKKYGFDMSSTLNIEEQIKIVNSISVKTDITKIVKFDYCIIRNLHDKVFLHYYNGEITDVKLKDFIDFYKQELKNLKLTDEDYTD